MKQPSIPDWHSPHNDSCAQNQNIKRDCTCVQKARRTRKCDIINRSCIRKKLLEEASSRQNRIYTQVKPQTLDMIAALVKKEIIRIADSAPRVGKTI